MILHKISYIHNLINYSPWDLSCKQRHKEFASYGFFSAQQVSWTWFPWIKNWACPWVFQNLNLNRHCQPFSQANPDPLLQRGCESEVGLRRHWLNRRRKSMSMERGTTTIQTLFSSKKTRKPNKWFKMRF